VAVVNNGQHHEIPLSSIVCCWSFVVDTKENHYSINSLQL